MKNLLAYYNRGPDDSCAKYGFFEIHRVEEEGALVGVEAMYEKGLTVQCPADCKVGWYYDGNGGFITAEQFAQIKKDPEVGPIKVGDKHKVDGFNIELPSHSPLSRRN